MNSRVKRRILNISSAIVVTMIMMLSFFLLISIVYNLVYIKTYVRGYSMQPTLNVNVTNPDQNGDTIYINKVRSLERNDIVVANVKWWAKGSIIKRLVGMPGDKIEIRDLGPEYGLFVNESLVYNYEKNEITKTHFEDYIDFINHNNRYGVDTTNNVGTTESGNKCIILNDDEYFLMGDNWEASDDCLKYGPVKSHNIVGRVELVIPYGTDNSFPIVMKFMFENLFS